MDVLCCDGYTVVVLVVDLVPDVLLGVNLDAATAGGDGVRR